MAFKYFNVKNGLTTGNIELHAANGNVQANTFLGNINVTSSANLGSVSNLVITGGTANYVLSTDGAGNLSWVAQSGGSSGNLEAYSDTFTGNGVQNTFTLSTTPSNINLVTVNYNGEILLRDSYSLSGANIVFTEPPANTAEIEITTLSGSGGGGGGGTPGGSNTQVQFNDAGSFGGNTGFTFNKTTTTLTANNFVATSTANLGNVANITVTGGSNGQVLTTNGSGGLSWSTISAASITNGNSNVSIPSSNGNVNISAVGNANVLVITGTGVNVAGTLNATGNANVGNIGAINGVFTNVSGNGASLSAITGSNVTGQVGNALVSGTVYTAAQPNITSVGTLTGLTVSGNATVGNLIGAVANGNSNVNIPAANGNVNISAAGNANILVVTGTGVNVAGTLNATGNANLGNLVSANFVQGTLTTASQPNITSVGTLSSLTATGNITSGNISTGSANLTGNITLSGGINDTGANFYTVGYREVPQVAKSANYTLENYDNGKHVYYTGSGSTLTIPADGSTTGGNFPIGTVLTVVNNSSGNVNINTSVTLNQAGTANTGNRILATKGLASIMKVDSNTWFISGVGIS